MRKIYLLLLPLLVFSCAKSVGDFLPERPSNGVKLDESMSPEFRKGWTDGCEVGMSAGSNTFYKMFYRNNAVDGYKMTSSEDYKAAWGNAFWYCYRYDQIKQTSSIWGSVFSGYQ